MTRHSKRARALTWRCAALGLVLGIVVTPLGAQRRLVNLRTSAVAPAYEMWSFGDGVYQPSVRGTDSVLIEQASQFSVPFSVAAPLGRNWTIDLSGAYATGEVTLNGADSVLSVDSYSLSGLSDLKLRAVGHLVRDNVLLTLGVNLPTGETSLDDEELSALRVLVAPALRFQTFGLGLGFGATTGVVVARQLLGWAWALGLSYEFRSAYDAPRALLGRASELNSGNAIHLSLGADGQLRQHGMTFGLTADFFTEDEFTPDTGGVEVVRGVQLGPIFTAEWQLRVAARGLRELTLYAVERYRTKFKLDGVTRAGSSGNYLDFGARGVFPTSRELGIMAGLEGRHHTGLDVDNTLVTAAIFSGGGTLGLVYERGGYALQPFVRGQVGRLDTGGTTTTITGVTAGLTAALRF